MNNPKLLQIRHKSFPHHFFVLQISHGWFHKGFLWLSMGFVLFLFNLIASVYDPNFLWGGVWFIFFIGVDRFNKFSFPSWNFGYVSVGRNS